MALVGHALSVFGGDLTEKPCFTGKRFSKSLCHGVDIIGLRQDIYGIPDMLQAAEIRDEGEDNLPCG